MVSRLDRGREFTGARPCLFRRGAGLDGSAGAAAGREAPAELKWHWRVLFNLVRWADRIQKRSNARARRSQIFPQTLEFPIGAACRPRGNSWADAAR